jgi:hypothetical protein
VDAQGDLANKAAASFKQGDYVAAARHGLDYLLPVIGPQIDQAGDLAQSGQYAKSAGQTAGIATNIAVPELIKGANIHLPTGELPERLYQSALKPSPALPASKVQGMIQSGLDNQIPVSAEGVTKLQGLIGDLGEKVKAQIEATPGTPAPRIAGLLQAAPTEIPLVASAPGEMPGALLPAARPGVPEAAFSPEARIKAGLSGLSPIRLTDATSPEEAYRYYATAGRGEVPNAPQSTQGVIITRDPALANQFSPVSQEPYRLPNGRTVDPRAVVQRLDDLKAKFANQVNPEDDLQAIESAKQEFIKNNPGPIPSVQAQAIKQGTYQQLKDRAYGQQSTATVEAQKALARGIKEELETQFPEIQGLNAQQGQAASLQKALTRAVQRIDNHQLLGIGTPLAAAAGGAVGGAPGAAVLGILKFVVDQPEFKSKLAYTLSRAGKGVPISAATARIAAYSDQLGNAMPDKDSADQTLRGAYTSMHNQEGGVP